VSSVRELYERFRLLIHEGAKFGIIGAIGVLVYNLVNGLLHFKLHTGPLTAATVAVIVTTLTSYIANRYWSFRHRERTTVPRETIMFFALNGVGLLIQWALVGFTAYGLGETGKLANLVANNVGIALGTLFRFWSYRKWVWVPSEVQRLRHGRHRKGRPETAAVSAGSVVVASVQQQSAGDTAPRT
jgi:putative flippase GtrA